jgi:hypothetical protein
VFWARYGNPFNVFANERNTTRQRLTVDPCWQLAQPDTQTRSLRRLKCVFIFDGLFLGLGDFTPPYHRLWALVYMSGLQHFAAPTMSHLHARLLHSRLPQN